MSAHRAVALVRIRDRWFERGQMAGRHRSIGTQTSFEMCVHNAPQHTLYELFVPCPSPIKIPLPHAAQIVSKSSQVFEGLASI